MALKFQIQTGLNKKKKKEDEDNNEEQSQSSVLSKRSDLAADTSIKDINVNSSGPSLASKGLDLAKKGTSALGGVSSGTLNAADQGGQMVAGIVDPEGEGAATVASTALTGASIGSVVPGIGTAIGAVVGLGLGLIKAESNKKKNEAARQAKAAEIMGNALQRQSEFRPIRLGALSGGNRDLKF